MNRTILLIEPQPETSAKIYKFLKDFGHLVETAATRTDALGVVKAMDPGLVLSNFTLPDGDAFILLDDVRNSVHSKAPVIIMASPKHVDYYSDKPMALAPQGWIARPVNQMELFNLISEWLGQSVEETVKPMEPKPAESPPKNTIKARRLVDRPDQPHPDPREAKPLNRLNSFIESVKTDSRLTITEQAGNLARIPVARLLYHFGKQKVTGVLTLFHEPHQMEVHFQGGLIVNVESNYLPDLALGLLLTKKHLLSPQELLSARKRWERDGGLFGQTLINMQLVDRAEINEALTEQRLKKIFSLFDWYWRSGTYAFEGDQNRVKAQPGFLVRHESIIVEGIRVCYDMDRLMMVFGKKNRMSAPATLKAVAVNQILDGPGAADLQKVCDAIRQTGSLTKGLKASQMPELDFLQFAYTLYVMDFITFAEPAGSSDVGAH